ncbi:MAG: hypothetical protein HRU40_16935 [Saprospiraceae bacterium]|nr:hypothetical protein [Saprospiraceae bacterium]
MNRLTYYFFTVALISTSFNSFAAAKLKYLSVKNDVVYFSLTENKSHTKLSCVSDENTEIWAFSLNESDADQKLTLLTTAFATNLSITVTPAGQCVDNLSVEKPREIYFG